MSIQTMLTDLSDHGITDAEIADAVGSTQPTIYRLRTGATNDPRYQLGKSIETYYRRMARRRGRNRLAATA